MCCMYFIMRQSITCVYFHGNASCIYFCRNYCVLASFFMHYKYFQ